MFGTLESNRGHREHGPGVPQHEGPSWPHPPPCEYEPQAQSRNSALTHKGGSAGPQLEPGHHPPAAPAPAPPRREARNELKPATAFRVAARRTQLRRPRPGAVGDLDPDGAVSGDDRDRDRLPGSTRAAMTDTVTEDLADQQNRVISARVPGAEYLADERAGGPRPARPARQASRSPGPPAQPSPHPPPWPPRPGKPAGQRAGAGKCTLSSAANVKPRTGPPPPTWSRGPSVACGPPSVAVRAKPTVPRTASRPTDAVAMCPWTPRYTRSAALQGDTRWDREETAR